MSNAPFRTRVGRGTVAAFAFALAAVPAAPAAEAYYVMVFGSQQVPNDPDYSHTFATFVRAVWQQPGAGPTLEAHTISWVPRTLQVRTLALRPECGANLDLDGTFRWVQTEARRTSMWGPYQIDRGLYIAALGQIRLLESGQVVYKANDVGYPTDQVSNCIHAVSSIVEGHRPRVVITAWGETASFRVTEQLMPWVQQPCVTHTWVSNALGVNRYPIIYRQTGENPRSGIVRGPVYRLFGGERTLQASYGPPG
jgi:hypothetical protein